MKSTVFLWPLSVSRLPRRVGYSGSLWSKLLEANANKGFIFLIFGIFLQSN